ncbi:hypothetical protein [Candidatus Nanohalococcus occultus]|uniref:Membrane protein n=1 Tax=Candidatus Nanohalococcus occultus TaxID=2978047 RepID=A0ABY8CEJ0_9ARCH|nr:putative membrane protein [Candidatus Nanohaloarchaeota archaeon SVXNc]
MKDYLQTSNVFGKKANTALSAVFALYLLANSFNILFDGALTWSLYGFTVLVLVFVPPVVFLEPKALVPFEILALLAVPFTIKGMELGFVASNTLNYITAAGIALLVVTELDTFTSFKTTPAFAVPLVSVTTVAVSGIWAVARWLSDIYLQTSLIVSEHALMWEFASALLAGIIAGFAFNIYFKRRDRRLKNEAF